MKFFAFILKLMFSLLLFTSSVSGQEFNSDIEEEISEILEDEYFSSTILSVSIYDLTAEKNLFDLNEKLLLRPASNMKLLTSLAALEYLGADYNFETSLFHTGIVMDSVCYGDLFVVGGFDPDFTTSDLDTLVFSLKEFGISEVRGNIYGDVSSMDSLFWGNGWMWDDDPSPDFPYMTPLIINDASVEIVYEPGLIGNPVHYKIIPETNYFNVSNNSITTREDTSDLTITRNWLNRGNEIIIKGDISYRQKVDTVKINLVKPEYYFLFLLKEKLADSKIRFNGIIDTLTLPEYAQFIYSNKRPLRNILDNLNKESDNLSTEMTLRALSLQYYGAPASAEKGIHRIDSLIAKTDLNFKKYSLIDGSGVSHYNLVSVELIVELLKYSYYKRDENFEIFYNSLPIAGIDGTLENRMRRGNAFNNVHAKTGTLSGVSNLSGYLKSADGHDLAFSIFIQNFKGSSRIARRYQDRICQFLSNLKFN